MRLLCTVLAVALYGAASPGPPVVRVSNLAYAGDAAWKHKLDLYLPSSPRDAPLVVFVHGGAFMHGDRSGVVAVGMALAREGYAVAIPSYRLFGETDAQGAVQDVAQALAWLAHHAREYGCDAGKLVLTGHSAGAQIAAMLATHRRYLDAAGAPPSLVRGAFVLGGAYDVRDLSDEPYEWQRIDERIYGKTPDDRIAISPALGIDPGTPSIVAVCGTHEDSGSCGRARWFIKRVQDAGSDGTALVAEADHMGLLSRFADPKDPLAATFRSFAERVTR